MASLMVTRTFLWLGKMSKLVSLAADPSLSDVERVNIDVVEVHLYSYTSIPSIHHASTLYLYVCYGIECTSNYTGRHKRHRERQFYSWTGLCTTQSLI